MVLEENAREGLLKQELIMGIEKIDLISFC